MRSDPIDVDECLRAVHSDAVGGVGLFVGTVRDSDDGQAVTALSYQAHPSAGEHLTAVCTEAAARLDGGPVLAVAALHRTGDLRIGEVAVVVAVSAVHRGPALATCAWLIDAIKSQTPIWKNQHFADGTSSWVGSP